jgi:phytoene synthase
LKSPSGCERYGDANLLPSVREKGGPLKGAHRLQLDPAAEPAYAAARDLCRREFKDLFFAAAFLPAPKRRAVYAIASFCKMVADALSPTATGGDPPPPSTLGAPSCSAGALDQTMALLVDRLDEIYEHRLDLPLPAFRDPTQHVLYAFARTVERYSIPKQLFLNFAQGCRMERSISRYATWPSLERYCYCGGGAVALAIGCVLGLQHSDAFDQVIQLGNAIKLTSILRDLKQDLARGRVYLPLEDLARFKVTQSDLFSGTVNGNFRRLMQFEIARARELYRKGAEGVCWLADDGSRLAASTMALFSSGILGAIERLHYEMFAKRPALTTVQKLRRLAPAWCLARRDASDPIPQVFT